MAISMSLTQGSPIPLYHQVARQLEDAIASGHLAKGEFLPNEIELAKTWGVSRPTVRRAIQKLVDQGLLVRQRGVGTQVVAAQLRRRSAVTSLYEEIQQAGRTPSTQVVVLAEEPADEHVAGRLELDVGATVVHLQRIRRTDGSPLALMENWLARDVVGELDRSALERDGLYRVLQARQVRPRVADRVIGAVAADRDQARALQLRTGAPLVAVELVMRDARGQCFDYGRHVYDAARYSIESRTVEP